MGCGASNSTGTRSTSSSANHYCKTCGSRQPDWTVKGCNICGAFNRLHTPTPTLTAPDFERTGSFALSELQRASAAEYPSSAQVGVEGTTISECAAVNKKYSENEGQNEMQEELGTLVSSTIENAIRRMNASEEETTTYPANENCDELHEPN